jgi:hypothetical protein
MINQRFGVIAAAAFGVLFVVLGVIDLGEREYSTGLGLLLLGLAVLARGAVGRAGASRAAQTTAAALFALAFVALLVSLVQRFGVAV